MSSFVTKEQYERIMQWSQSHSGSPIVTVIITADAKFDRSKVATEVRKAVVAPHVE